MKKENINILRAKILKGISLAYDRMLTSKQKEDEEIVISQNGKVVKIKARELSH